jgi:trehalose-6-phosphate synthase
MSTEKEARSAMNQQRQQEKHLQQSMLSRAEALVETPTSDGIEAEARELMAEQRQQEESLQQSMLSRAESEVGFP